MLLVLGGCRSAHMDSSSGSTGDTGPAGQTGGVEGGATAGTTSRPAGWHTLIINEFMASNDGSVVNSSGDHPDWIELYNPGNSAISLGGWSMSDDPKEIELSLLDDFLTVEAGGFLVLWADGEPEQGPEHLSFELDISGDRIGLYTPEGTVADSLVFLQQASDLSAARVPDGSDTWMIAEQPTPGESNGK